MSDHDRRARADALLARFEMLEEGMSAGRLAEALAPFVTCGERYCDTFDNGNPNCDDCGQRRELAAQRVLDLLASDETREVVANVIPLGFTSRDPYDNVDEAARAALDVIRTHLTTPTKEEA